MTHHPLSHSIVLLLYYTQNVGQLYAKLVDEDEDRPVYFEPHPNPARSVMRVAKDDIEHARVIRSYPWDRGEFY